MKLYLEKLQNSKFCSLHRIPAYTNELKSNFFSILLQNWIATVESLQNETY